MRSELNDEQEHQTSTDFGTKGGYQMEGVRKKRKNLFEGGCPQKRSSIERKARLWA